MLGRSVVLRTFAMERSRAIQPYRGSLRSRDSSSTRSSDPREKVKDCCRKLVAFMCTQVGVGGLVVGYTIVGAFGFKYIETSIESKELLVVQENRNNCAEELWRVAEEHNIINGTLFRKGVNDELKKFQESLVHSIKKGYNGVSVVEMWSFPAALMFSLSIITMIGYGNLVPRTQLGRGVTVVYAVFGIPLYILYFMNMGKILAQTFKWLYTWLYRCTAEPRNGSNASDEDVEPLKKIIVPSTACLWVIGLYVLTGTIMFAEWEKWEYLDSSYFCVTSLCKIGMGDFVPGANIQESKKSGNQTKLVINYLYLLLGLGLVAMCYNLMREEVKVKMQELKEDLGQCLEDCRMRAIRCCGRRRQPTT